MSQLQITNFLAADNINLIKTYKKQNEKPVCCGENYCCNKPVLTTSGCQCCDIDRCVCMNHCWLPCGCRIQCVCCETTCSERFGICICGTIIYFSMFILYPFWAIAQCIIGCVRKQKCFLCCTYWKIQGLHAQLCQLDTMYKNKDQLMEQIKEIQKRRPKPEKKVAENKQEGAQNATANQPVLSPSTVTQQSNVVPADAGGVQLVPSLQ